MVETSNTVELAKKGACLRSGLGWSGSPLSERMTALVEYENWLLERFSGSVPQGLERLTDERWTAHVQAELPCSDFTWEQYVAHVEAGEGDEWFHMEAASPASSLLDSEES